MSDLIQLTRETFNELVAERDGARRERDELKAEVERLADWLIHEQDHEGDVYNLVQTLRSNVSEAYKAAEKFMDERDRLRAENAEQRAALALIANELEGCGSSAECVDTAQRCIDEARASLAKHAE